MTAVVGTVAHVGRHDSPPSSLVAVAGMAARGCGRRVAIGKEARCRGRGRCVATSVEARERPRPPSSTAVVAGMVALPRRRRWQARWPSDVDLDPAATVSDLVLAGSDLGLGFFFSKIDILCCFT
jgi:hypothetical protein